MTLTANPRRALVSDLFWTRCIFYLSLHSFRLDTARAFGARNGWRQDRWCLNPELQVWNRNREMDIRGGANVWKRPGCTYTQPGPPLTSPHVDLVAHSLRKTTQWRHALQRRAPLCANTTTSIKPEIGLHNMPWRRQRWTEPRPCTKCTWNLMKIGPLVPEIC